MLLTVGLPRRVEGLLVLPLGGGHVLVPRKLARDDHIGDERREDGEEGHGDGTEERLREREEAREERLDLRAVAEL